MDQLAMLGPHDEEPTGTARKPPDSTKAAARKTVGTKAAAKKAPAKKPKAPVVPAVELPIARVAVDVSAAAVDRTFEYVIPEKLSAAALIGCRVRVRFAGRLVDGFVLERSATAEHTGRLAPVERVSGPPVLIPEVLELSRAVADRYAGTLADVLRDAVPPRQATVERALTGRPTSQQQSGSAAGPVVSADAAEMWDGYLGGHAMLARLKSGEQLRAAIVVAPIHDPTAMVADLVAGVDGSAIVIVPDARDLDRFAAALAARFGDRVARLSAAAPPAQRYRSFLNILRGHCDIVVGTRNAAFSPVSDPRLVIVWDDGDEALTEPRAPGWHAREVLALRSHLSRASWLALSHSRSVDVQRLVATGWARSVEPQRGLRRAAARVVTLDDTPLREPEVAGVRIPHVAWRALRDHCHQGPVLVQVARSGYQPAMACADCRTPAQCDVCTGPLATLESGGALACRWCGEQADDWRCGNCGGRRLRSMSVGSERTAEELSRAFPKVPVRISGRAGGVLDQVGPEPAIVVATVGAEPVAQGGYRAAVLLDGAALLSRSDLRTEEETVRRWFNVLALVRGSDQAGQVVVTAEPGQRAVQALLRVDPQGWASRELDERTETKLPPVWRAAAITGHPTDITAFVARMKVDPGWRVLGPVALRYSHQAGTERVLVLVPPPDAVALAHRVKSTLAVTTDRGGEHRLQVRLDPISLF